MRASATNKVPLKISATDDFGVGAIKVIFHRLGGPEQAILANREGEQRCSHVAPTAGFRHRLRADQHHGTKADNEHHQVEEADQPGRIKYR